MNNAVLKLIVNPARLPVSLNEVRLHLRLDDSRSEEEAYLYSLIRTAATHAEEYTGRALIHRGYELQLDAFPGPRCPIELPKPPLSGVDSVSYTDANGVLQVMSAADYLVDAPHSPSAGHGCVRLAYGKSWPSARGGPGDVVLAFTAGYGPAPGDVPESLRHAMLLMIGHWYTHREAVVTGAVATSLPLSAIALLNLLRVPTSI